MKQKRFNVEQIVAVLKQAEAGVPSAELIRRGLQNGSALYSVTLSRSKSEFLCGRDDCAETWFLMETRLSRINSPRGCSFAST